MLLPDSRKIGYGVSGARVAMPVMFVISSEVAPVFETVTIITSSVPP
jgi:hypothetical protein